MEKKSESLHFVQCTKNGVTYKTSFFLKQGDNLQEKARDAMEELFLCNGQIFNSEIVIDPEKTCSSIGFFN